jgi:zinc/manganese transport system substrate-binding protein
MSDSEPTRRKTIFALAAALALVVAACGQTTPSSDTDKPTVVVSTTIWGDVVKNIVGDKADVEVLVPIGLDPHDFQPSSRQIAALQTADLVVVNGLGLEQAFLDVVESAVSDGAVVLEVGRYVEPFEFGDPGQPCDPAADAGSCDPHVWLDPVRVSMGVDEIVVALETVVPDVDWSSEASSYLAELGDADAAIAAMLDVVPTDARVLVTNHDAFSYFAERYGFRIAATVIPGGTTLGSPSSAELAELVETMRAEDINVIFAETTAPSVLADAVAAEVGGPVKVVELFSGSLGEPGSGAETLIALWSTNAMRIAGSLGR